MPRKSSNKLSYLKLSRVIEFLTCPKCFITPKSSLYYKNGDFYCKGCKQKYPVRGKIIELINPDVLSEQVKRELLGNDITPTKKNIEHYSKKDRWSRYYNHFVNQKINYLLKMMKRTNFKGIISLGSGSGFEIKEILKKKRFPLVISSDLAYSATRIVPHTLKGFDLTVCLFTSDLNFTPVIPNEFYPILIYEALHHTKNSIKTLGKMMQKGYQNIFFVEPCTNFLVKIMVKLGLAQRAEYSGVIPDFVDLSKVKNLASKHKYSVSINTIWEIPEDYFRIICKKKSILQQILLCFIDIISRVGNLFQFGSFAIVSLKRTN